MNAVLNTPHTRTTAEWQAADAAHYLHPFTDFKGLANKGSRVITKADNIYLWDSDGKKILDAMSGLWCVNLGYGRKELVEAARVQLERLPYYNSFFQCTHPAALELTGIPYTGAGMQGMVIGNDRNLVKQLLEANEIPTPPFQLVSRRSARLQDDLGLPLIDLLQSLPGGKQNHRPPRGTPSPWPGVYRELSATVQGLIFTLLPGG